MPGLTRKKPKGRTLARKQKRRGVTAMEYLMMISLIVVACLVAIGYLGGQNNANMSSSSTAIDKAMKKSS